MVFSVFKNDNKTSNCDLSLQLKVSQSFSVTRENPVLLNQELRRLMSEENRGREPMSAHSG